LGHGSYQGTHHSKSEKDGFHLIEIECYEAILLNLINGD